VARIFKFVDMSGCELHTINDPVDQLPIPVHGQEITLGSDRMWVESVMASSTSPQTYYVRVSGHERLGTRIHTAHPRYFREGDFGRPFRWWRDLDCA